MVVNHAGNISEKKYISFIQKKINKKRTVDKPEIEETDLCCCFPLFHFYS